MRREVMHLDVAHVGGVADGGQHVAPAHECEQVGIVCDALVARLKVDDVHRIEAHERLIQPQVDPSKVGSGEELVAAPGEVLFESVKRGEELAVRNLVRLLRASKSAAVCRGEFQSSDIWVSNGGNGKQAGRDGIPRLRDRDRLTHTRRC